MQCNTPLRFKLQFYDAIVLCKRTYNLCLIKIEVYVDTSDVLKLQSKKGTDMGSLVNKKLL